MVRGRGWRGQWNYPELLIYTSSTDKVKVHIGVEAAMTGVSRYMELNPAWK